MSDAGIFRPRVFTAFLLILSGVCLAALSFDDHPAARPSGDHYMPVPGGEPDDLDRLETEWNNRLTYPTGRFDPAWVRAAAAEDARVARSIPFGARSSLQLPNGPAALDPTNFTSLGPQPLRMTGCSGCFDYTLTEGRVNDIVVDPTTTTNGSIVAYAATVGGGVWKTANCCSSSTTWSVTTDNNPLLATISIDTLTIDPHDHLTIYAGTGDLSYGSFSMGSQGILKSTDGGATWILLGANVFGPALPQPAGQFPQYNAVGKVRVDPRNSNNVVAGTKTGLYFSYDGGANWSGPCTTNNFSSQRQDITGLALIDNGSSTSVIAAVGVRGFATTVQYNLNQNGANGIYKGTLPASGCPGDFGPIATDANGWAGTHATSGTPYGGAGVGNQAGRIDIAVAPGNSNYIYAQVQAITPNTNAGCGNANGCQLGAYRSTDGGATWTLISSSPGNSLKDCEAGDGDYNQNWYDQGIAVDPNNPDRVFFDTFEIWFWDGSTPATAAAPWNDTTCGYNTINNNVHVDQHALAFVPGSSSILLAGNDGGIHATTNANIATAVTDPSWFNMDGGLNTIEFYSGDISGNFANVPSPQANAGAQDNGAMSVTFSGSSIGPAQWQTGKGGDGFYGRIDPVGTGSSLRFFQGNNDGAISRCVSNCTASGASWSTVRTWASSETRSFILPYDLFHGGIPGGDDCAPAGVPGGCGHLIAGTTRVWETVAGGNATMSSSTSWYITNNPSTQNLTKGTLGNRSFINQVKYSPKYESVAIAGTNDGNVWIGFNLGTGTASQANWVDVTAGNAVLPNRPVLGIALDPSVSAANTPIGYAAVGGFNENTPTTPGHVFRVDCNANCATPVWQNKSGNLPNIPVDAIIVNPNLPRQVFAGTDWGLYYTDDITAAPPVWARFENKLPHSMIWDLQIDRGSTTLSVWTRGRGAYVWPLPTSGAPAPTATPTSTPTTTATASPTATATATPTASATASPTPTPSATASPTASPTPAQLLNISTRANVLTGDNLLIGGFIVTGNDVKKVLLLAKGPSVPVQGRMSNPTLELHAGNGSLMTSNDDWKDSPDRALIESSGLAPTDDRESAIVRTLVPGAYTGVLAGKDNSTGIALIEIYDLDANSSVLANISSRGRVDAGDNVMIGGFIAGNQSANTRVLVRGIGPSLQGSVPGALADPMLELHDSNGATLETNDDWKQSPNRAEIEATGIPPGNDAESAIIRSVPPAGYTAILRGKTGAGIGVVEIYNLR